MKAVIPAAGLGTRLLPITKSIPKELLPVGRKPAIQWVMEEAVGAGLREFIVIDSPRKAILRDYFRRLEDGHPLAGNPAMADLERLLKEVDVVFVQQPAPLGLRDAVWRCAPLVGSDPFALLLPDNVTLTSDLVKQLLDVHSRTGHTCVAAYTFGASQGYLDSSDCVMVVDEGKTGVLPVRKVIPTSSRPAYKQSWRVGMGRYVFAGSTMSYFAPHEYGISAGTENNEEPILNILSDRGGLLCIESKSKVWHIGLVDEYFDAFSRFSRKEAAEIAKTHFEADAEIERQR